MASKIIVADSGPLIALALLDLIKELPEIAGEIIIPQSVYSECINDLNKPGAKIIQKAVDNNQVNIYTMANSNLLTELTTLLDPGEAEAIMLYKEIDADLLLIDEIKGRKVAEKHKISITGTAAILLKAKQKSIRPLVKPMIDELLANNYRLSSSLIDHILKISDELPEKNNRIGLRD